MFQVYRPHPSASIQGRKSVSSFHLKSLSAVCKLFIFIFWLILFPFCCFLHLSLRILPQKAVLQYFLIDADLFVAPISLFAVVFYTHGVLVCFALDSALAWEFEILLRKTKLKEKRSKITTILEIL